MPYRPMEKPDLTTSPTPPVPPADAAASAILRPFKIKLEQASELALFNSREFQEARENLAAAGQNRPDLEPAQGKAGAAGVNHLMERCLTPRRKEAGVEAKGSLLTKSILPIII